MKRRVILFELNEVPQRLVDWYCQRHPDAALAKLTQRARGFETYATDVGHLSPWKTWPTVHRGVNDERHLIADFGQDLDEVDKAFPPIWKLAQQAGLRTGVCASLHSYPVPTDTAQVAFHLPDPFAPKPEAIPESLVPFQDLNLTMSRASARSVSSRIPLDVALSVLKTLPQLGIRPHTALDILRQLVSERTEKWTIIRRRTYQSVLAFDIFMAQLKRTRPELSTFFTNHVASSMHRYWAATFPDDYERNAYPADWIVQYGNELDFTMGQADAFLARLLQFVDRDPEYQLWVATSMGQAATQALPVETQLYLLRPDQFMQRLGFGPEDWERLPAMEPQVNVMISERAVTRMREVCERIVLDDEPLTFRQAEGGFFSLDFGHANLDPRNAYIAYGQERIPFNELGLENVEIQDKSGSSAYHIPEGCLMVYDPRSARPAGATRQRVETTEIAPALLKGLGVTPPSYMSAPRLDGYLS